METSYSLEAVKMTDGELVAEFQHTHNNDCFAELYKRYFHKVKNYCRKALGSDFIAEDVAQDILIKAYEKLPTLKDPRLWVAWLFRIARNEVLNRHKRNARRRTEPVDGFSLLAEEPTDYESFWEKERKLAALPVLLESSGARILKLKYLEKHSIKEICEALQMGESAVKMRLLRARRKVARQYARQRDRA